MDRRCREWFTRDEANNRGEWVYDVKEVHVRGGPQSKVRLYSAAVLRASSEHNLPGARKLSFLLNEIGVCVKHGAFLQRTTYLVPWRKIFIKQFIIIRYYGLESHVHKSPPLFRVNWIQFTVPEHVTLKGIKLSNLSLENIFPWRLSISV
jgi:hypothetical protein